MAHGIAFHFAPWSLLHDVAPVLWPVPQVQSARVGVAVELPALASGLLRLARHQAGITQAELARRAGVSASMVCAYERERRQPTLTTLLRLLEAAGYELAMQLVPTDDSAGCSARGQRWPPAIAESWDQYLRATASRDRPSHPPPGAVAG